MGENLRTTPRDTIQRIANYLEGFATKPFSIDGVEYTPMKYLWISRTFFRAYSCPAFCGGCCRWVSLVFFESDVNKFISKYPEKQGELFEDSILVNGKEKKIWRLKSDYSYEERISRTGKKIMYDKCKYLRDTDKRCEIHDQTPFACRFSLKNLLIEKGENRAILTKRLPGRAWVLNPPYGAKCKMLEFSMSSYLEDIRDLRELKDIADDLEIETNIEKTLHILEKIRLVIEQRKRIPSNGKLFVARNF